MTVSYFGSSRSALVTGDISMSVGTSVDTRGVLVFVIVAGTVDVVTGATCGGTSMVEVPGSPVLHSTGEGGVVHGYFLSPVTGGVDLTIAVTTTGGSVNKIGAAMSLNAAASLEVVDTSTISSDSLANPSVTVSLAGRTSFCAIGGFSGQQNTSGMTAKDANWSVISGIIDYGAQVGGAYTYGVIGSADVAAGWTQTAEDAVGLAVAISELTSLTVAAPVVTAPLVLPALAVFQLGSGSGFVYTPAKAALARGELDILTQDWRVLLVAHYTAAENNPDAQYVGDINPLDEFDGAGYTRLALKEEAVTRDDATNCAWLDAAEVTWPTLGVGTRRIANAVLYRHVGADSINPVIACLGRGGAGLANPYHEAFRLSWQEAAGLLRVS